MQSFSLPELSKELAKRIQIVRRDIGTLLFHFTKNPKKEVITNRDSFTINFGDTARSVLGKILFEEKLIGTSTWIESNDKCICFTEAPISELVALFSLVDIAADEKQRPRYEPYGVAVTKEWLYSKGGRPAIYDDKKVLKKLPQRLKYRYVPYDPKHNVDFTWEREWRIKKDNLLLDPAHTLVVVPEAETAFDIMSGNIHKDLAMNSNKGQGWVSGIHPESKWISVSLDLFGMKTQIASALNSSIKELGIEKQILNILKKAKLKTIGDLVKKTEKDLLNYNNLGKKSLAKIKRALKRKRFSLQKIK